MINKVELPNLAADIRQHVGDYEEALPVEDWMPEREGEIDIRIAKDGRWFYQGVSMERDSVVQLFSTILRKDGDDYFLVTPVEKMKIMVEDAPFIIRMMDIEGKGKKQKIHVSSNVGDCFTLSAMHPLTVLYSDGGEPSPYVTVRRNLTARISRPVYYELAELAVVSESDSERYGIWSDGQFYLI